MPTLFARIVAGELSAYKVAEDAHHLAFLDVQPIALGHTLVIPKVAVDYIFDLDPTAYAALWAFAHQVAHQLKAAVPCVKVGIAVIGLEVPHAHIHLVPMHTLADLNFAGPRLQPTPAAMQALAARVAG